MDALFLQRVWERVSAACEYSRLPRAYSFPAFEIDHMIARCHRANPSSEKNAYFI